MAAFWYALWLVFIAEMGDKTQLVALTLSARYNAKVVLAGVFCATLVVHVISVLLGGCVGSLIPGEWVGYIAGLAFIFFGCWTLRGDCLDDDEECKIKSGSPFWIVSTTFFLAELGDKTMLTTCTVAAGGNLIPVWLGSTLGMVLADGLAIVVGQVVGAKLPEKAIKIGAAMMFFAYGIYKSVVAGAKLPSLVWIVTIVAAAVIGAVYLAMTRRGKQAPKIEAEAEAEESVAELSSRR